MWGLKTKLMVLQALLLLALGSPAQKSKKESPILNNITISFENKVGGQLLDMDSVYQNAFGEAFTVTQFKYYISNISFNDAAGKEAKIPDTYFLINQQDSAGKSITISTPLSVITGINFLIGIDSIKNVSGVQTGVLDPLNGMFWTWSTGYIMAKLEAVSPVSKAPQSRVTYHIGGFTAPYNAVKKISLPLGSLLQLHPANISRISISADINKWFSGASDIRIADHNFCMNPGSLSNAIAANYAAMFSIQSISLSK
ncbi:MAG: MbnP family protein [Chitinophagaceae bacterium]